MSCGACQMALAKRVRMSWVQWRRSLRRHARRAAFIPVPRVSQADLCQSGNDLRFEQAAVAHLVQDDLPGHAIKERHFQYRTRSTPWRHPDGCLDDEAQARSSHALERNASKRLKGNVQMDDAYVGGARSGRRGRGAPGKTPFVAAIATTDDGKPDQIILRPVKAFSNFAIRKLASTALTPGARIVSDGLACFAAVTQAGCLHTSIKTRRGKQAARTPAVKWVNTALGNIKAALVGTYRAVREKHVPRYLAEFEYRFNRRYDLKTMIPRLAFVALRTAPMPYRLLKLADVAA